jgi:UDP-N-acetylglucosamine acyltransferase
MVRGINAIGMRRRGLKQEVRSAVKEAYRLIYRSGLNVSQALARITEEIQPFPEVSEVVEFFKTTKRGVAGLVTENAELMEEFPSEAI